MIQWKASSPLVVSYYLLKTSNAGVLLGSPNDQPMFDSNESNSITCPFIDNGVRGIQIPSIKRQTAELMNSPPRPRYNRFRLMVGTSSVNNASILFGKELSTPFSDKANTISARPNTDGPMVQWWMILIGIPS
jgi:hypothetical protein